MKGFIFTTDAIFSLIVASAAVTILVYSYYIAPASYQASASTAYSVLQTMSQTTMGQISQNVQYASFATLGFASSQYSWPQYGQNGALNSSTYSFAPVGPDLMFQFAAPNTIYPNPVVADGMVFFTTNAGIGSSRLYGINATTGAVVVNTLLGGPFSTGPVFYNHIIITANTAGYLNAISESNSLVWSTFVRPGGSPGSTYVQTSPLTIEGGYLQSQSMLLYPMNGTPVGGGPVLNIGGIDGAIGPVITGAPDSYVYKYTSNNALTLYECVSLPLNSTALAACTTNALGSGTSLTVTPVTPPANTFFVVVKDTVSGQLSQWQEVLQVPTSKYPSGSGAYEATLAYSSGIFYGAYNGTTSSNALFGGYVLGPTVLTNVWTAKGRFGNTVSTIPAAAANFSIIESGSYMYMISSGGTIMWVRQLSANFVGGVATDGLAAYAQTSNGIYGFTTSSNSVQLLSAKTPTNNYNVTPALSQIIYALSGNVLQGFQQQGGAPMWNLTLPSSQVSHQYGDVALAYGNAYVVVGNTLYAFGMCKADPQQSVLAALAEMYVRGQAACANKIFSVLYPGGRIGMFINNQYASSLDLARFNAPGGSSLSVQSSNTAMSSYNALTISGWVNVVPMSKNPASGSLGDQIWEAPSGSGSAIALEAIPAGVWTTATQMDFAVNTISGGSSQACSSPSNYNFNQWYFVTEELASSKVLLYVNGSLVCNVPLSLSAPVGPLYIGGSYGSYGYMNGTITGVQFYNTSLSTNQILSLYQSGIAGQPISGQPLVGFWPLEGDTNDYGGLFNTAFPSNIAYGSMNFIPPTLLASTQVSRASATVLLNITGQSAEYNVSVVVWR